MSISSRNGAAISFDPTSATAPPRCASTRSGTDPRARAGCPPRLAASLAHHLLEARGEGVDVRLVDHLAGHDDDAVLRNPGLVAFEVRGHQLHALIAPL